MNNLRFRKNLLFLAGITFCFESVSFSFGGRPFSLSFFLLLAYIFLSFTVYRKNIIAIGDSRPLFLFNLLLTVMNIINMDGATSSIIHTSIWACFFLFYFLLLDDRHNQGISSYAINGMAIGTVIMSILYLFGIGVEIDPASYRLSMFGDNENAFGIKLAIGFILIFYNYVLLDYFNLKKKRFLFIIPLLVIVSGIVSSGSRTAFLVLLFEIMICIFAYDKGDIVKKFVVCIIASIVVYFLVNNVFDADLLLDRFRTTIDDGDTSGRGDITRFLLPKILEHPVFGIGHTGYSKVDVLGIAKGFSPHNVIIEVLMYTGVVGLLFIGVFWLKIFKKALVCFKHGEILPLVLSIPVIALLLSGQILQTKYIYVIFVYIISRYKQLYAINKSELRNTVFPENTERFDLKLKKKV